LRLKMKGERACQKKIRIIKFSFLILIIFICLGLGTYWIFTKQKLNNRLPCKKIQLQEEYIENKAILNFPKELKKFTIYNKNNLSLKEKNFIAGDILEVYYKDKQYTNIDHVLVDKAKILEIKAMIYPCDTKVSLIAEDMFIYNLGENIEYVIHEDKSCTEKNEMLLVDKFYGSYREELVEYEEFSTPRCELIALYSYKIR